MDLEKHTSNQSIKQAEIISDNYITVLSPFKHIHRYFNLASMQASLHSYQRNNTSCISVCKVKMLFNEYIKHCKASGPPHIQFYLLILLGFPD